MGELPYLLTAYTVRSSRVGLPVLTTHFAATTVEDPPVADGGSAVSAGLNIGSIEPRPSDYEGENEPKYEDE